MFLSVVAIVVLVVACSTPVFVAVAGRLAESPNAAHRWLAKAVAIPGLFVAFDLSCLSIWGVFARRSPGILWWLLGALLLAQPLALWLAVRVASARSPVP